MDYLKLIPIAAMIYALTLAGLSYFTSYDTVDRLMNPLGVLVSYVILLAIKFIIDGNKKSEEKAESSVES